MESESARRERRLRAFDQRQSARAHAAVSGFFCFVLFLFFLGGGVLCDSQFVWGEDGFSIWLC